MFSEHSKWDVGVLKLGPDKEQPPPQFVIHGEMVVGVDTADVNCKVSRKQDLRLDYVTAGIPDSFELDEIFQ
jgi:hypothetical protein